MTLYNVKKAFLFIVLLLISESAVALSALPNIAFYGRVIDQYGQPVKDATVGYTGENAYISAGGGMGVVRTDDAGYFMIDTRGAALELSGVGHPEIDYISYESPKRLVSSSRNERESLQRFLPHDKDRYALNYNNYLEKEKAYIIQAWRLGEYEGAIGGNVRSGFNRTGDIYTLNLTGQTYKQVKLKGAQKGHLRVSCTRQHMESVRDYGDWTASITPINGGIQESDDLYTNLAPETGYKPSLDIVMRKGNKDYRHKLTNKRYYFTTNNGQAHGSLFVHFEPHAKYEDGRFCIMDITYKINPTGSHNLELR